MPTTTHTKGRNNIACTSDFDIVTLRRLEAKLEGRRRRRRRVLSLRKKLFSLAKRSFYYSKENARYHITTWQEYFKNSLWNWDGRKWRRTRRRTREFVLWMRFSFFPFHHLLNLIIHEIKYVGWFYSRLIVYASSSTTVTDYDYTTTTPFAQ